MFNHSIMMAIFMCVNILLGSGIAIIDGTKQFEWSIFFRGCLKAATIAIAIIALNYAGTFVPDMAVISLNGQEFTVQNALLLVIDGAIITYAYKSFLNLYSLLKLDTSEVVIEEVDIYHKDSEELG